MNPRIAARQYARQASALARAELHADAAETLVRLTWENLLRVIPSFSRFNRPTEQVHDALAFFSDKLVYFLDHVLYRTAEWSHTTAVHIVLGELHVQEARPTKADVIPPPDAQQVRKIVYQSGWSDRIRSQTALGHPSRVVEKISRGIQAGKSYQEIAEDLLPIFDGIRSTARRVARDETMNVANRMQWEAWESLGELVYAYQVWAVLDKGTRAEHRKRHKTVYYKDPVPGQLGMGDCPHPPRESESDGSVWAYGCRCHLVPWVKDNRRQPKPQDIGGPSLDDRVMQAWWANADWRERRAAVGAERYGLVRKLKGRKRPQWGDFFNARSETLFSPGEIRARLAGLIR